MGYVGQRAGNTYILLGEITMCEYVRIKDNQMICKVDNKPCALCVFGNKKLYLEGKRREQKAGCI